MRGIQKSLLIPVIALAISAQAYPIHQFTNAYTVNKNIVAESLFDYNEDGLIDSWQIATDQGENVTIRLNRKQVVSEVIIKANSGSNNLIVEWKQKSNKLMLQRFVLYPKRTYGMNDDSEPALADFSAYQSSKKEKACDKSQLLDAEENFRCLKEAVKSEKFKDRISNKCERISKRISKEAIAKAIYKFGEDNGDGLDLVSCMQSVAKKVDIEGGEYSEDRNCQMFRGAFGDLKNLLNLDIGQNANFKINCETVSDLPGGKCISGNFKEGVGKKGDVITLKFSAGCQDLSEENLQEVVYHEMLHRVIPSSIMAGFGEDKIESGVKSFTSFCKSKERDFKKLCAFTFNETKTVTLARKVQTQIDTHKDQLPVKLTEETPVSKVVLPNAFPLMNQYVGSPSISASAALTGAAAERAAQDRISPVLNFARAMVGSVARAQVSGQFEEGKTYSYDLAGGSLAGTAERSGRGRSPANESLSPNSGGAEGSSFNAVGSLKPTLENGRQRTYEQIAEEKAKALARSSSKIPADKKEQAEKVLAYILRARDKYELKKFLVHRKRDLDSLQIHVVDARANEIFGYEDSDSANMNFSISNNGKLIDETLNP